MDKIYDSNNEELWFYPMNKRHRGYPSETSVRKGINIVHGNKELIESVDQVVAFKRCCRNSGRYDGIGRQYYF